jgi:2-haloacid dehalogenase
MMVAAHVGDLTAAKALGLRTTFIHRPDEYGPTRAADKATSGDFDVVSSDMVDLAAKLGRKKSLFWKLAG